jgi:uncharacterized protein
MKRCTYALPERQWLWTVEMPDDATVGDALREARLQAGELDVPWNAETGIFGESCAREFRFRDGDRIELYRPLSSDPKASRRARAAAVKAAADLASARPRTSAPKKTR